MSISLRRCFCFLIKQFLLELHSCKQLRDIDQGFNDPFHWMTECGELTARRRLVYVAFLGLAPMWQSSFMIIVLWWLATSNPWRCTFGWMITP